MALVGSSYSCRENHVDTNHQTSLHGDRGTEDNAVQLFLHYCSSTVALRDLRIYEILRPLRIPQLAVTKLKVYEKVSTYFKCMSQAGSEGQQAETKLLASVQTSTMASAGTSASKRQDRFHGAFTGGFSAGFYNSVRMKSLVTVELYMHNLFGTRILYCCVFVFME